MVSMVRTVVIVTASTQVDSIVVTAWEAQVPLVLLDLALSYLWRWEAEGHQALLAEAAQVQAGQVAPAAPLLRLLPRLYVKQDNVNASVKRPLRSDY